MLSSFPALNHSSSMLTSLVGRHGSQADGSLVGLVENESSSHKGALIGSLVIEKWFVMTVDTGL